MSGSDSQGGRRRRDVWIKAKDDAVARVVLVGWGAIGRRVAGLLAERPVAGVDLVGVGLRPGSEVPADLPRGAVAVIGPDALAEIAPDLVVEAAGRASVSEWGLAALAARADFAPASTSALTDTTLLEGLLAAAKAAGRQILIAPGALGGMDALAAASRLGLESVRHEIVKPPRAWAGTGAEGLCDLAALQGPTVFFEGSALEAANRFPQNANVAVISALAGAGMERTRVALVADPAALRNAHRITALGAFGSLRIELENRPLADNPKSSELTALSLLRLIANRASPLVI